MTCPRVCSAASPTSAARTSGSQMRRPLAHQVRRPEHTVRTGRDRRALPRRGGRRRRQAFARPVDRGTEVVAHPAQRQPGRLRDAHDVPSARHRVAERVDTALGIERRPLGGGEDDAGRADRDAHRSRARDAHAHGARCLVAGASDDRRARRESGGGRRLAGHVRADLRRFVDLGQHVSAEPGGLDHLVGPSTPSDIEQQRSRGIRHVGRIRAAQPEPHVVLRQQDVTHAGPDVRFVRPHPQQSGQREVGERRVEREFEQTARADVLVEPAALARSSAGRTR